MLTKITVYSLKTQSSGGGVGGGFGFQNVSQKKL